MNHRTGLDRSQTLLFPERLEDYIGPENSVRFLDAFVASLDLHTLGFAKARCANTGRPPYDPAALLKLYLYGYLHRVRSSRLLEAECQRNVEVLWLLGKLAPDFKTIADFRKDNLKPLQAVARQFTLLCRKLELFGGELLAIDGSRFSAVNARDQNFQADKLKDLIARADARLAEYLQQLDAGDAAEPGSATLNQSELAAKIAALQEKQDWHKELLGELDQEHKQISVTDPANRTITREANEHLMEAMAARMKQQPQKFKLRKLLAEHPFGTIKRWFGYTHFLLKGLAKVQCEWSLTTLTYNLKRVLNLVSFQKLMAAVA